MSDELTLRLVEVLERLVQGIERQAQLLDRLERRLATGDEELITLEEAARRLGGCSIRTVWRYIHAGKLVSRRHGKYTRVVAESVSLLNGIVRRSR